MLGILTIKLSEIILKLSKYQSKSKLLVFLDDIGADMWYYQACSEMVMPFCYDGINDMFEVQQWDLDQFSKDCVKVRKLNVNHRIFKKQCF